MYSFKINDGTMYVIIRPEENRKDNIINMQVLHSSDGKHFYYSGVGRFCNTQEEADAYEKSYVNMKRMQELWQAVCSGDIPLMRKYYLKGGAKNRRYNKFGINHSLIAGAYRNNQNEMVNYLLSVGETTEQHEQNEIKIDYFDYTIIVKRNDDTEEKITVKDRNNAFTVYHCFSNIAVNSAENIASVSIKHLGDIIQQTSY